MGRKIGKTPWEHVKPTKYLTRQDVKRLRTNALSLPAGDRPIIERNVTPHPKMAVYIRAMQDTQKNKQTCNLYSLRTAGTTKHSYSKRGKPVRVIYNIILKKEEKKKCINYIKAQIKNANFTDVNKATRIQEKLIKRVLAAKPNTTLVIDPRRIYKQKWQSTITFTDDMFQRNIAKQP